MRSADSQSVGRHQWLKRRLAYGAFFLLSLIAVGGAVIYSKVEGQKASPSDRIRMRQIADFLRSKKLETGRYLTTAEWNSLTSENRSEDQPSLKFIELLRSDIYGTPYRYESDGQSFRIQTLGRDRAPGGVDGTPDEDLFIEQRGDKIIENF